MDHRDWEALVLPGADAATPELRFLGSAGRVEVTVRPEAGRDGARFKVSVAEAADRRGMTGEWTDYRTVDRLGTADTFSDALTTAIRAVVAIDRRATHWPVDQ